MSRYLSPIDLSIAKSRMWDYLMDLSEEGRIDDDALMHIFNQYVELLHSLGGD